MDVKENKPEPKSRLKSSNYPLEWVSRSRAGDHAAMELLYQHFRSPFLGLAYRYTYNTTVSEDLLQDIFVKIFSHVHELDSDGAFTGWAYKIAVNTCLSYLRHKKAILSKETALEDVPGISYGKQDIQHENMLQHQLEGAMQDLSPKLKSVFILHDIQGFKHEEIAQIMGCSIGTSKSQLFKARMKLKKRLDKKSLYEE
jgi:RNA polymerase sigma-70 factor (ECF subfamily)